MCGWEDDNVQYNDPAFEEGANVVSLRKARENFKTFGASDPGSVKNVRKPLPEEISR